MSAYDTATGARVPRALVVCRYVRLFGSWLVACRPCFASVVIDDKSGGENLAFDQVFWVADFARRHVAEHAAGRVIFPEGQWERWGTGDGV